jgi:hypothetical protein
MKRATLVLAALTLLFGDAGSARAGIIIYDLSGTLSLASGPDQLGLNGASISLTETVDPSATPTTFGFIPALHIYTARYQTITTSLTISGASVSTTNGTYTTPLLLTVLSRPTGDQIVFGLEEAIVGLHNLTAGGVNLPAGTVQISGHAIPPTYSAGSVVSFMQLHEVPPGNQDQSLYNLTNGHSTGTFVAPEPSALALAATGLPGLATVILYRRRRRATTG